MRLLFTVLLMILMSVTVIAQTGTDSLFSSKDNTLYQDAEGDVSNGTGIHFFTGRTNAGSLRRAVFEFDLSSLPSNIEITAGTLRLGVAKTKSTVLKDHFLHALTQDWGEGTSDAGNSGDGDGTSAMENDATWIYTFFATLNDPAWNTPGGDFVASPTDTVEIGNTGIYEFVLNEKTVELLQLWYENPDTNFGFILIGDEENNATAKSINSREQVSPSNRPQLKVEYDAITAINDIALIPADFILRANYPNPFNPTTTIDYRIARSADINLEIYNSIGQRIRSLESGFRSAGDYSVVWDGKNDIGQSVPSGNYFYRLKAGNMHQVRKMLLLK